ncbi:MAG: hypothetical protein WC760_13795, partial [Bacteroidia bacterium]
MQGLFVAALLHAAGMAWAQKPPAWFVDPPKDNAEAWYGVGEGPDPGAARRAALRTVAAKLRSAIEGEVKNKIIAVSKDGKETVDVQAETRVVERVAKTEFGGVEVESSAKSSAGYVVLVKVDRPRFLRDTRGKLDVVGKPIGEAEATLATASTLEQFLALRRVGTQLEEAVNLSLLLTGAGAEGEGRPAFARYSGLQQRSQQVASKLVFELKFKPEDADIAKAVTAFLTDQGMRTASTPTRGANALSMDTQVRQDDIDGNKLMKLKVRFSVADDQGRTVASREHDASGASRYDFRGARDSAIAKLNAALRS